MTNLFEQLMQRQMPNQQANGIFSGQNPRGQMPAGPPPPAPNMSNSSVPPPISTPMPSFPPMKGATTPPRDQRFQTAEKMKAGYANGWKPNPIMTRLQGGG